MSYLSLAVRREVIRCARRCCEYCLLHANYTTFVHEIDYILLRKHGGVDSEDNLAYERA
jgi:5-methylcytosine-specific restriction endonuclease McrA